MCEMWSCINGRHLFAMRTYLYLLSGIFFCQSVHAAAVVTKPATNCSDLVTPLFGAMSASGNQPNDEVKYKCDTGYTMTSGDNRRTCLADYTWTGTTPTCEPQGSNVETGQTFSLYVGRFCRGVALQTLDNIRSTVECAKNCLYSSSCKAANFYAREHKCVVVNNILYTIPSDLDVDANVNYIEVKR